MLASVSYTNVTLSREIAPSTFIIARTHDTVAQWLLRYEVMSTRPSCNEVLSVVNVFNTLMSPIWSSQFVIKRFSGPRWGFFPHNLRTTLEWSVKKQQRSNSNGTTDFIATVSNVQIKRIKQLNVARFFFLTRTCDTFSYRPFKHFLV